jgi:hypothetical protein
MKPIAELVVAPKIVMASPIFGITTEMPKQIAVKMKVTNKFCFLFKV